MGQVARALPLRPSKTGNDGNTWHRVAARRTPPQISANTARACCEPGAAPLGQREGWDGRPACEFRVTGSELGNLMTRLMSEFTRKTGLGKGD